MESATIAHIHFTPTAPRRTAAITAQLGIINPPDSNSDWSYDRSGLAALDEEPIELAGDPGA